MFLWYAGTMLLAILVLFWGVGRLKSNDVEGQKYRILNDDD